MKLCLVSPCPPRYLALGNYATALLPSLAQMPAVDEIVVLGDRRAEFPESLSRKVRVVQAWDGDSPRALPQIVSALKAEQPDLVWYNTGMMLGRGPISNMARICALTLTRRSGTPSVVTLHNMMAAAPLKYLGVGSTPLHRMAGHVATMILLKADVVCFTLRRYVELARTHYGTENAVHIPHHGFGPPHSRAVSRRGTRVLAFGTLAPFKGLDVLLSAFSQAVSRAADLRLVIAGGEHPRFPGYTVRPDPRGPVRCLGALSDTQVNALIQWSDVVVIPSLVATGASSVMHRAVAAGKTIIASDLEDFRAAASEMDFAVRFCGPGDVTGLARAMVEVAGDRDYRAWAAVKNLRAAQALTPEHIASRYMYVFNLLASPSPSLELAARPVA